MLLVYKRVENWFLGRFVVSVHWLNSKYNPELMQVVCAIVSAEREEGEIKLERFGVAGTIGLLEELDKLGILKGRDKHFPEGVTARHFSAKSLLDWTVNEYLTSFVDSHGAYPLSVSDKEHVETIKAVKAFLSTEFFKNYFYGRVFRRIEHFYCLDNLTDILQDLFMEANLSKTPVQNNKEYHLLLNASKKIKKNYPYGHQAEIQGEIDSYFYRNPNSDEKKLIDLIQSELDQGLDMIPIKEIIIKMHEKGFTKQKTLNTLKKLEENGDGFYPRKEYFKLIKQIPKRWFK